ncbi:hypothetical protein [Microlunatus speluncae]|uniref:hypothetical protein n=1 Tax=Microlunatus speluncae TaxID=2594267 RepID=UPI001FECA30E|nr:hypothetical protein [Microlunatus speluncae]
MGLIREQGLVKVDDVITRQEIHFGELARRSPDDGEVVGHQSGLLIHSANRLGLAELRQRDLLSGRRNPFDP